MRTLKIIFLRFLSITLLACICAATAVRFALPAFAESSAEELMKTAREICGWEKKRYGILQGESLFSGKFLENAGTDSADWFALGVSRFGFEEDYSAYLAALSDSVSRQYEQDGGLDEIKATEWHRAALTALAMGGDPTDINGIDLIGDGVYGRSESDSPGRQGINGWIFALITLDSMGWKTPEDCLFDREYIIGEILSCRNKDGGFSLSGGESDVDVTAMAVQALSVYYNDFSRADVRETVDGALDFLSGKQGKDGSFGSCEADAQVLTALCDMGIDFEKDERFKKDKDLFTALLSYQNEDGGFAHERGGESQELSSAQALCAVAAAERNMLTMRRIYDFREEITALRREKLDGVNGRLEEISDEAGAISCLKLFNDLSCDERTYINGYDKLLSAAKTYELTMSDRVFAEELSQNESGRGCIYSIENTEIYSPNESFTKKDMQSYEALMKRGASSSDCAVTAVLLSKAKADEGLADRERIISDLKALNDEAERLYGELSQLNKLIGEKLYPVDSVGKNNRELLKETAERIEKLPESERRKVTSADEILSAAKNAESKTVVIAGVLIAAVCVTTAAVLWKRCKISGKRDKNA